MGLHDRPYMQEEQKRYGGGGGGMGGMRVGMPKPTGVIRYLLIINIAVLVASRFGEGMVFDLFAVKASLWWQLWRYVTFQFLHAGMFHLFFNMLALYFLGMHLERAWGSKRFLTFYLLCGAVGGVAHVVMTHALSQYAEIPLVGASGGVYGVLIACAILFPHIRLILLLFPVSIRVAVALFLGMAVYNVLDGIITARGGGGAMGGGVSDPAHLGGAIVGAAWVWLGPRLRSRMAAGSARRGQGRWQKKLQRGRDEQQEINRILDKIRNQGIGSLSDSERRTLQRATDRQQQDFR
ncbi:hypothetical protein LCGC14_1631800 [marine sediment metagenome]|uniref:Uncharacterized protein n=1 Tax=marine sediment metagenome TaxID=412755 RepID=A0A0F9KI05_9ZZZZ